MSKLLSEVMSHSTDPLDADPLYMYIVCLSVSFQSYNFSVLNEYAVHIVYLSLYNLLVVP